MRMNILKCMDEQYESVLLNEIAKRDRKIHWLKVAVGALTSIVGCLIGLLVFFLS